MSYLWARLRKNYIDGLIFTEIEKNVIKQPKIKIKCKLFNTN